MKKSLLFLFIAAVIGFTAACSDDGGSSAPAGTPDTPAASQDLDEAKTALTTESITFNGTDTIDSVTGNLTFPAAGMNGTSITWSSGDSAIIANDGTVTRPFVIDKTVTFTATITLNGESVTKQFTFTVTGTPADYYVSPSGNDTSGNGSKANPYAQLPRRLHQPYPATGLPLLPAHTL